MKKKLIFDVTDSNTIAASDSVGAYLRASDGTLIDHQNVNSENWINVAALLYDDAGAAISDSNPLAVSVKDGVNVEVDLSHIDDSVRLGDGTNFFTSTSENGDIALDVHVSNSDLDIRDLVYTQDSIEAYQGGSWTIASITNDVNIADGGNSITVDDGGSSLTVDASDLDIRDLSQAQDSIQSWLYDSAGNGLTSTLVGSDQALDVNLVNTISVNDAALANTAIASAANALGVANTAEDIVASPLANRKYLFVMNNGNRTIYIGASGVTSANGYPLNPQDEIIMRAGASIDIEWVGPNTNQEVRTLELS